ncbi:hypothetical protein [Faecalimicrobium dakarense]|uniref:hypothetical protein n=1 Tax=Faecalimicrobium dakarense TaxID=1301100 RepID=UPI0005A659DF|nr:hypothetical protein [[Clostridium] dakarense]
MFSFYQFIFVVVMWILYYLILKIFILNKKLDNYIEKVKLNGDHNEIYITQYKKYLNAKNISSTLTLMVLTFVVFMLRPMQINSLLELAVVLGTGALIQILGDRFIDKKYTYKK